MKTVRIIIGFAIFLLGSTLLHEINPDIGVPITLMIIGSIMVLRSS